MESLLFLTTGAALSFLICAVLNRIWRARLRAELASAQEQLTHTFQSLSHQALSSNMQNFMQSAELHLQHLQSGNRTELQHKHELIDRLGQQISDNISAMNRSLQEIEKQRIAGDAQLRTQLAQLHTTSERVGSEAQRLHQALSNVRVQGHWGEEQLRTVVESAGMLAHCDFVEQPHVAGDQHSLRPDLVVRLPNGCKVIVDAKVPMQKYLEAMQSTDGAIRAEKLREHGDALRRHIRDTAARGYPKHFMPALDYTLIFLPGESLFFAALEADGEMLRYAQEQRVLLVTPTSLIAFLRAVACGWSEVKVQEHAREIQALGCELHERFRRFTTLFGKLGRSLNDSVRDYNQAAGCLERRVLVTARRFNELGVGLEKLPEEAVLLDCTPSILASNVQSLQDQ